MTLEKNYKGEISMAIITKIVNGKKYLIEATYIGVEKGKQKYKYKSLGHLDEAGNFIPSKKMRGKKIEDFPAEIQQVTTTTTKIRVVEKRNNEPIEPEIVDEAQNEKNEATEEINSKTFSKVWQGTATNELAKITTSKNVPVDSFRNVVKIKNGDFELSLENFSQITGVRTSTHKLLDILMMTYSDTGKKEVAISLDDFMKLRGLKDKKTSEEQVKEDLATIYRASISFKQKEGNKTVSYDDVRIIQDKGQGLKNGMIRATFGDKFFNAMQNYHVMPMPPVFLAINDRHNPNAYHLGRRIALHKNMNYGKPNENLISIETLLEACPNLETHEEEIKERNYKYREKIIEPFERDMNALEETGIFTWEYCHSNAMPLTDEEIKNLNYKTFKNLLIKITWHTYPLREIKLKENKPKTRKTKKKINQSEQN